MYNFYDFEEFGHVHPKTLLPIDAFLETQQVDPKDGISVTRKSLNSY